MNQLIAVLGKIFQILGGMALVLIAIVIFILYSAGNLTSERLSILGRILRGEDIGTLSKTTDERPTVELEKLKLMLKERERSLQRKERELAKYEEILDTRMRELQKEKMLLEAERERIRKIMEEKPPGRKITPASTTDEKFRSNLAIFSKMEPADIVNILRWWDDETIARYLRQLKPAKATEILRLLGEDPKFTKPDKNGVRRIDNILGETTKRP